MSTKVLEQQGNLICMRHNKKVEMVILDNSIPFSDTLCCSTCLEEKSTTSKKIVSLEQTQSIINERYSIISDNRQANKESLVKHLQIFLQKMMDARSEFIQNIDKILSITQEEIMSLQNFQEKPETFNLLRELEKLYLNNKVQNIEEDQLQKMQSEYLTIMDLSFQKLIDFEEFQKYFDYLKSIDVLQKKQGNSDDDSGSVIQNIVNDKVKPISYELIQSVKQSEYSAAIAFNTSGSIMVAACKNDIIVWKFDGGNLIEQQRLKGHVNTVLCLTFSKMSNWFFSGCQGETIQCWKEVGNNDWVSCKPQHQHNDYILCLLLNHNEDELISCSRDNTIKVWNVKSEQNEIQFYYNLENKHSNWIYAISMNQAETSLVSCCKDKQIILWMKGQNEKWQYKNHVAKDDFGRRICFISDNQISWQQGNQGITHIFEIQNGNLIEKPELKIKLNDSDYDDWLFPTIFNKSKQVMIQKYDRYVYIIRKQNNGQFKIESEPIDCNDSQNYGTLTDNGEYLVIWNRETKEFRVYRISY